MTRILHGDCVEQMQQMPDASIDAIATDPPYGLEFMGKDWDSFKPSDARLRSRVDGRTNDAEKSIVTTPEAYRAGQPFQAWTQAWAEEALRVLKPGGHLLAFGGARTYHRLAAGIEDAGFEIRDTIAWMYGSGFPKSLDVSKAIDKAGAEREVVGLKPAVWKGPAHEVFGAESRQVDEDGYVRGTITAPATPEAAAWEGWGTALKPAHEPIVVARKPLAGTVAQTVLAHGTGALNIDGCRIGTEATTRVRTADDFGLVNDDGWQPTPGTNGSESGRWPANVVLDPEAAALLDEQSGETVSRVGKPRGAAAGDGWGMTATGAEYDDSGGASRFLYVAKAGTDERNAGLAIASLFTPEDAPSRNDHPTVKPVDLMRWLVRLVTPPGGVVLDPFTGSGTTGIACALEGFDFVGIERDDAYVRIARARIAHWSNGTQEAA